MKISIQKTIGKFLRVSSIVTTMSDSLVKLDSLLTILSLNCSIEEIPLEVVYNESNSKIPDMNWNFKYWRKTLSKSEPRLNNVIELLERRDFREEEFGGESFVELAVNLDSPKLIENDTSISYDTLRPAVVIDKGSVKVIKFLIDRGYTPTKGDIVLFLKISIGRNHLEMVKYLFSVMDIDPKNVTVDCIELATRNGDLEMIKYLVSIGCDPKRSGDYSIKLAKSRGYNEIVEYLVEVGCDPDAFFSPRW